MRFVLVTVLTFVTFHAEAGGKAKHIVVVVWDGLRPDSVSEKATPTLFKLAHDGVFFQNHHAVFVSSTEVNGVAMATGAYPNRSGILANREYRPAINPLKSIDIAAADSIRNGDEVTTGHYLKLPTLPEILRAAGRKTAIAGSKPIAVLMDRSNRAHIKQPDNAKPETPNTPADAAMTRALVGPMWDAGVPAFSLLWLSEPDQTQHMTGPGSERSIEVLRGSDRNLALVLSELDAKHARKDTDIFVVSDHGFSTISRAINTVGELKKAGFNATREFKEPPHARDILVVPNGGSVLLYVIGHDKGVTRRIVEFLQQQDWTGVLFTREPIPGTFTLDQARLNIDDAPDIVVAMHWTDDKSAVGLPGTTASDGWGRGPGQGIHAGLSRYDMRAALVAAGPDFRRGMIDELPSSNVDLAPTILWLLGVDISVPMDGRILLEAMPLKPPKFPPVETRALQTGADLERSAWRQYLSITEFAGSVYFDEGNGASAPKSAP